MTHDEPVAKGVAREHRADEPSPAERGAAAEHAAPSEPAARGLSELGLLMASAVHDLNNAMSALRAHLYVAQIQLGQPQPLRECQSILDRCSSLTGWLLALCSSSGDRGKLLWRGQPSDLRDSVTGALTLLRHSLPPNIQVQSELGDEPALVAIDPDLMSHAVLNLLLNARDASSAGGQILAKIQPAADAWQLTVEDSGEGMDEETLRRAVEPLFTTKAERGNTGIGLPSVLRVVQSAGGTLQLDSKPGAGTRATVTLPRAGVARGAPA